MNLDTKILENVSKRCARFTVGDPTTPTADGTYVGGVPFGAAGAVWPSSGSGPLTFLGQFGLAAGSWLPGTDRWLSVFLNEAEGYVEPGDDQYCTIWLLEGKRHPVAVPDGARTDEARSVVYTEALSFPMQNDARLGDWRDDGEAYEKAAQELGGTDNRGECQIGGYPLVYGGGDLRVSTPKGAATYQLIAGFTRHPLLNGGFDVNIVDVLNIYFDTEDKVLVADMDR